MTEQLENKESRSIGKLRLSCLFLLFSVSIGIVADAITGFSNFSSASSILPWIARTLVVGILVTTTMVYVSWVGGTDEKGDPLYKRAFKLLSVLIALGLMYLIWSGIDFYFEQ